MFEELAEKRILVTGATGFVGKHLVKFLRDVGAIVLPWPDSARYELTDIFETRCYFAGQLPIDYVIHLAGYNGGIAFNVENPADIFFRNTVMGLNVLECCKRYGVRKVVSTITSCGYPDRPLWDQGGETDGIMDEKWYLDGPPHDSVACHGYAKRNLVLASKYYDQQYGLNAVTVAPTTIYGPGDRLEVNRTKVMGGLIRKFIDAKRNGDSSVECWGTGEPLREFIYVEDAVKYILLSLLTYDDSTQPLNVGSGQEISIKNLVNKIAKAVEYDKEIVWDTSRPDGQMRKLLDRTRQNKILGEFPLTSLDDGIKKTVEWAQRELSK